jgi:hypothetical protein
MSRLQHHVAFTETTTVTIRHPGTETAAAPVIHAAIPTENDTRCGRPVVHREPHRSFEHTETLGRCHACLTIVMADH